MVLASPADQERLIARVLDQGMAKGINVVLRGMRGTLWQDDFRSDKTSKYPIDFVLSFTADGCQKRAAEVAADHGSKLGQLPGIGAEPIEPGQQGCLQRLGNTVVAEKIAGF